jgi:hypothetical protein
MGCSGPGLQTHACSVIWASELQTEVVSSGTESERAGPFESLQIGIVIMNSHVSEMKSFGIPIIETIPMVFCKLFEDNAGASHLAKVPNKMHPGTRRTNQKCPHFREWRVKAGWIDILPADTSTWVVQPGWRSVDKAPS